MIDPVAADKVFRTNFPRLPDPATEYRRGRADVLNELLSEAEAIYAEEDGFPKDWLLMWEALTDRIEKMQLEAYRD